MLGRQRIEAAAARLACFRRPGGWGFQNCRTAGGPLGAPHVFQVQASWVGRSLAGSPQSPAQTRPGPGAEPER